MRSTGPDSNFANVEGGIAFDFTESGGHVMAARLADDAVTEIQLQAGRRAFLKRRDVSREVKDWVRGEPGSRFTALIGVDAYTVGDYVVVVNRAQVLVDARSLPKGQFYRKYRRSGEVDPHAKVAELKDQVVKEWDDFASEVQLLTPDAGQKRIDEILELQNEVRREYNTIRPHSSLRYRPPAPEALRPDPFFLNLPKLNGPHPRLQEALGLTQ